MFGKTVDRGIVEWRDKIAQSNSGNRGEECLETGEQENIGRIEIACIE